VNLQEVVDLIGGEVINPIFSLKICNVQPSHAADESDIVFLFKPQPAGIKTRARLVVGVQVIDGFSGTQIIHPNPRLAMAKVLKWLYPSPTLDLAHAVHQKSDIHPSVQLGAPVEINAFACIKENTTIGAHTIIGSNVFVGHHCQIGEHVQIASNVSIYPHTIIQDHTVIHANCVIGSDGFGYEKNNLEWEKIPHIGKVVIGKNVEIGAQTSIDRGCLTNTVIGNGVKIDNNVQIAHNCSIGDFTVVAGGCKIAGSSSVGKNCILAGNVDVKDNVNIGDNVMVFGRSGVTKSVKNGEVLSGFPAINHKLNLKKEAFLNGLFKGRN
jgi:UDP-3-O-[3-hydroxymyristoyl] glucosamine N-acyltransferase